MDIIRDWSILKVESIEALQHFWSARAYSHVTIICKNLASLSDRICFRFVYMMAQGASKSRP